MWGGGQGAGEMAGKMAGEAKQLVLTGCTGGGGGRGEAGGGGGRRVRRVEGRAGENKYRHMLKI